MKHQNWMTRALLIGSITLGLSACAVPGDFCDVVQAPLTFEPETSTRIVATDRPTGERISAQNDYWRSNCS